MNHDPRIPGSRGALCRGCGEVFTSVSGFDNHQTVSRGGDAQCHDPAARGLVQRPDGVWAHPPPSGPAWPNRRPGTDEQAATHTSGTPWASEADLTLPQAPDEHFPRSHPSPNGDHLEHP